MYGLYMSVKAHTERFSTSVLRNLGCDTRCFKSVISKLKAAHWHIMFSYRITHCIAINVAINRSVETESDDTLIQGKGFQRVLHFVVFNFALLSNVQLHYIGFYHARASFPKLACRRPSCRFVKISHGGGRHYKLIEVTSRSCVM